MASSSSLNVIALISGGKDSLFSILHCQANGHTIVALANLHPEQQSANDNDDKDEEEDIDSYMYQTVGHAIIPLYEQALDLPLYRQAITGEAVNSSRDYEQSAVAKEQDETEDLVPLLQRIMTAHPEANAVSTGAILSTYQRTRVESVALRLGLTPLSYLWQYPLLPPYSQSALLHDMAAVGQEAVIIKTASGGLDESFLGLNVADQRTIARLSKAMVRFGEAGNGAIVGEGGEFETLALDGPRGLWKRRIRLGSHEARVVDGGQTIMKIMESSLEEKMEGEGDGGGELRRPELFDEEFSKILSAAEKSDIKDIDPAIKSAPSSTSPPPSTTNPNSIPNQTTQLLSAFDISDSPTVFSCPNIVDFPHPPPRSSPSQQLAVIFQRLDQLLNRFHLSKTAINHCTLLLRNMSDFTVLNPIYAKYFSSVNPPARVTVAVGDALPVTPSRPPFVDVMLSVILDKTVDVNDMGEKRQGLHVQGRSYWAPANIGPYSQAVSVPLPPVSSSALGDGDGEDEEQRQANAGEIVYVAGQIPLVPASMEVYSPNSFRGQAVLSLQHLWRIGRAKGVKWWTAGVGFIPASIEDVEGAGNVARDAWSRLHTLNQREQTEDGDEEDDDDGEDAEIDPWDLKNKTGAPIFNDSTYRALIPSPSALKSTSGQKSLPIPPCFIVQIHSLPRNVDIEWSATGLTSSSISFSSSISSPSNSRSSFYAFEISDKAGCEELWKRKWASGTLYVGRGFEWNEGRKVEGVGWVPCYRVWGRAGEEVKGVFVGRVDEG